MNLEYPRTVRGPPQLPPPPPPQSCSLFVLPRRSLSLTSSRTNSTCLWKKVLPHSHYIVPVQPPSDSDIEQECCTCERTRDGTDGPAAAGGGLTVRLSERSSHAEAAGPAAAHRGRTAARVFQIRHLGEQAGAHGPSHQEGQGLRLLLASACL